MEHFKEKEKEPVSSKIKTALQKIAARLFQRKESDERRPNALFIFLLVTVIIIVLALPLLLILPKALSTPEVEPEEPIEVAVLTPIDKSGFDLGAEHYTVDQGSSNSTLIGIDVSEHQGIIDWQAVADNGISFAFIRIGNRGYTAGDITPDSQFETNYNAARDVDIKVGAYFFSQAINENEARAEADFVLSQLAGRSLDYPIAYDFETISEADGRANALTREQRSRNALAFCERIESNGYQAMLYGNMRDLSYYDASLLANYAIWFAEYNVNQPSPGYNFSIWQFTSSGVINGIGTFVDLNIQFDPSDENQLPANVIIHHDELE